MNTAPQMIKPESRLRLSWLDDQLATDTKFAEAAIDILRKERPKDTFTTATAGMALIEHWMEQRDLPCYERGQEIDSTTGTVFLENITEGMDAIAHNRYVSREELLDTCKTWSIAPPSCVSGATDSENQRSKRPPQQQRHQEDVIIETIKSLGYDPKCLPEINPGMPWVKSEVWEKLKDNFTDSVFSHAWDRLRADKRIQGG